MQPSQTKFPWRVMLAVILATLGLLLWTGYHRQGALQEDQAREAATETQWLKEHPEEAKQRQEEAKQQEEAFERWMAAQKEAERQKAAWDDWAADQAPWLTKEDKRAARENREATRRVIEEAEEGGKKAPSDLNAFLPAKPQEAPQPQGPR